ncbi:hypothetical protein ABT329_41590, partial [Streptomyces minutiscleroticus]
MRGRPLHTDPTVAPAPPSTQQVRRAAAHATPAGAASSAQALGATTPQVTMDYKVARHIASQVAKQREELLKTAVEDLRAVSVPSPDAVPTSRRDAFS